MSGSEAFVQNHLLELFRELKINKLEYQALMNIFRQEEIVKRLSQIDNDDELKDELLRIVSETAISINIPTRITTQDELSSPLDSILLTKKKEADKQPHHSFGLGNLTKID